jgi:NhaP-type Na+/H+ or K+/H+ antiporter
VAGELAPGEVGRLLVVVVAVWLALMVVRFGFQTLSVFLIRLLDRRASQRARRMSYRARVVSSFAGFRGAISLAIALSVPETVDDGGPFTGRDEIIFVTAGVIVLTLLVQGPLLPAVVRWARLPDDTAMDAELRLAERAVTTTAVEAIPELAEEHAISAVVREQLTREYAERLTRLDADDDRVGVADRAGEEPGGSGPAATDGEAEAMTPPREVDLAEPSPRSRDDEQLRLRVAILDRKREVLIRLRHEGTIDDSVARRVQTRLDVEELRLTGVEPLD